MKAEGRSTAVSQLISKLTYPRRGLDVYYPLLVILIVLGVYLLGVAISHSSKRPQAIALIILSAVIGCCAGSFVVGSYDPPWTRLSIHPSPAIPVSIAHVDINSTQDDPGGDVLFIEAVDGRVYSLRLFEDQWELVDQVPEPGNVIHTENCATDWPNHPLVEERIIDSVGFRIDHALATILRCYVLMDDHSLQVWVHSSDGWALFDVIKLKVIFAAIGGILAILVVFLLLLRTRRTLDRSIDESDVHV
jgi:hypothetical protein